MINKNTISAVLAAFNEEENIKKCIESLKTFASEIVVCDGNSSDNTAKIAKELGAKVIKTTNKKMFHINKNMAIDNASSEWVFLIDADERVSTKLAEEIKKVIAQESEFKGYWISRKNWFLGGFLTKGGAYPDPVIRLFKNGFGRLPEKSVHEQVNVLGKVGHLKQDIIHLADPSFSRYLLRANRYTDITSDKLSELKVSRGALSVFSYMITKPIITFLLIYVRHFGFKDGFRGFVWALFSGAHHFYSYVKYIEKHPTK